MIDEILRYFAETGSHRRLVLFGCTILGISSGLIGCFAVLRRESLMGDAMAHAALPGVCLAFLVTGTRHPLFILLGATFTGLIGGLLILFIQRNSRIKNDAALGIILSVFFAAGIVLLSYIQQVGLSGQAGLETFLFGQAASMAESDVLTLGVMAGVLVVLVVLFFKEFQMVSFDPGFTASLGFPVHGLDIFLTFLIVLAVMIGLQVVGVVLMAAMLILPASAARQWTNKLERMLVLSAVFGGFSGATGAGISTMVGGLPTGPVMVTSAAVLLGISLLFAPGRGLLQKWWSHWRRRRQASRDNFLKECYRYLEDDYSFDHPLSLEDMQDVTGRDREVTKKLVSELEGEGFFERTENGVVFTERGLRQARKIVRYHRLWELYLTEQVRVSADHVHGDAEKMEHYMDPHLMDEIADRLGDPDKDPHGRRIPDKDEVASWTHS